MAKKQRVPHDVLHRQAQLEVLGAMVRGEDLDGLTAAVAPSEVPNWFTPDVAVLELAVTALELATPAGTDRLVYEGLRERYLPEVQFRGAPSTAVASTPCTPRPPCVVASSPTCSTTQAGGRPDFGRTPSAPSSSTHALPPNGTTRLLSRSHRTSPHATSSRPTSPPGAQTRTRRYATCPGSRRSPRFMRREELALPTCRAWPLASRTKQRRAA